MDIERLKHIKELYLSDMEDYGDTPCSKSARINTAITLRDFIEYVENVVKDNLDKPSIVEKLKRNKELAINEINQSSSGEFYVTKKGYKCYLHHKVVDLKYNRKQTIYYFALNKKEKDYLNINDLPKGKKIVESPKTGLPYVKSIR